jgi:hypothetical protein
MQGHKMNKETRQASQAQAYIEKYIGLIKG